MLFRFLPLGLLLVAVFAPLSLPGQEPAQDARVPDLDRVRKLVLEETNQFRKENGKGKLTENTKLASAAQDFAEFMARTDKYSHTADGKEPWQRMADHGYEYCLAEENIEWQLNGEGFTTEELAHALVEGWKKSPPHRKNMLNDYVQEIGIGVAHSEKTGRYYGVQDFGRPKSAEMSFQVENTTADVVHYSVDGKPVEVQPRTIMTHKACVPPELRFEQPGKKEAKTYHPGQGVRYVLRSQDEGGFSIAEEAAKSGSK